MRPSIIVVALNIHPQQGSEPGKGWWWATALSKFFDLHVITHRQDAEACLEELGSNANGWTFHPTERSVTTWKIPTGYFQYHKWLDEAMDKIVKIMASTEISGLCHIILGSFRMLPRYDRLDIPYTVGPLGGGECSPVSYLTRKSVPLRHRMIEFIRPAINRSFALHPSLRFCLAGSRTALATSEETASQLRAMGARNVIAIFPDAYDRPVDISSITENRRSKLRDVGRTIRLLWQGRPLWWKCPDLALEILAQATKEGIRAELTMVGDWEGDMGKLLRKRAGQLGIASLVQFVPSMKREQFLELQEEQHAFIATSLHDSGGIPLIEAQARGLPCLTLGLGGNRLAACPEAGVAEGGGTPTEFIRRSVVCLREWQNCPEVWLRHAEAALRHSTSFTNSRLQGYVSEYILPNFEKSRVK